MFEDVLQLRASYATVITELEKGDLEQAVYHQAKAIGLAKVLTKSGCMKKED